MDFTLSFLLIFIGYPSRSTGITTIHHDKPEDSSISVMATKMSDTKKLELANITLTASERHKRLLPYTNFYQTQSFNSPPYQPPVDKYRFVQKKVNNYDDYHNSQDALYQSQHKFTPFLESNAIPGPFRPMVQNPSPARVEVQYVPQNKVPNYSEIYDKLAQLKLRQNYREPSYVQVNRPIQPQRYVLKPQVNYNRYKIFRPSKTTIETFTATSIDIPSAEGENQYEHAKNFESLREGTKPLASKPNYGQKEYPVLEPYQEVTRKPFIIVPVPPQDREPRPLIVIQRKPVFREKQRYNTQKVPQYIQVAPPSEQYNEPLRYVTPKYEQFPKYHVISNSDYQDTPSSENPLKYELGSPPKLKEFQAALPPLQAPPKYQDITPSKPKYKEYHVLPPTAETSHEYPESARYPDIPKYGDYHDAPQKQLVSIQYGEYDGAPPPTKTSSGLAEILSHLQSTNTLPKTLTADNIDNSIKTLVRILDALKKQQKLSKPIIVQDSSSSDYDDGISNEAGVGVGGDLAHLPIAVGQHFPEDTPDGGTPGKPGVDYPALSTIPKTTFNCKTQRYKGFFGDPDTNCQVWHYCDLNGGQSSFLCPNGTIFSQVALTCDWWYNVKCSSTAQLYVLNERLYKYIIPLSPKFPEDYSGPLVDKYLALKFQQMEEKMRKEKKGKGNSSEESDSEESQDVESEDTEKVDSSTKNPYQKETLETIEDANEN
nr:uncharacterized protein LOC111502325 [Leptinotarsa decemlineata]